jgi:urease beta subunit
MEQAFNRHEHAFQYSPYTNTRTEICTHTGTAVRFEPGETKTVALVEIAGHKVIRGGALSLRWLN